MSEAPDYKVLSINLADLAGKERQEVWRGGNPYGAVTVVELPVAAVGKVRMAFGAQSDLFQLRQEAMPIPRRPPRTDPIYLKVDAGVVGNLELMVGLDLLLGV